MVSNQLLIKINVEKILSTDSTKKMSIYSIHSSVHLSFYKNQKTFLVVMIYRSLKFLENILKTNKHLLFNSICSLTFMKKLRLKCGRDIYCHVMKKPWCKSISPGNFTFNFYLRIFFNKGGPKKFKSWREKSLINFP